MTCKPTETPDVDIGELREKYLSERDKRVRPEGSGQYVEVADDLAHFWDVDHYASPNEREPIAAEPDVAIIGGGFAGLIIAARLKQAGVTDLRIIEMGSDYGGTWYWNRYPGVQCDVEGYTYMPMLEELGYVPRDRYAYGGEIYDHCRRIADRFGLYENAMFGTSVESVRWDASTNRWRIVTNRGDELRARFVVMATGVLSKPKLPGIPGIRDFKGKSFHSSRWDYAYTGGDTDGGLTGLADKRVAIIGTGATGIQIVPHLARYAQHLYVVQRTPAAVFERRNMATDPEWARALKPGWQFERQRSFQRAVFEGFSTAGEDLICDSWSVISHNLAARLDAMGNPELGADELAKMREEEDYRVMERLRRRIDSIVTDKETAEKLKPYYRFLCKRPCFNDEYLPAFNRPNVTLVDVSGSKGVERITRNGIVAGGVEYEVDCIIYASGFEVTHDHKRKFGMEAIDGRDGLSLYDHWRDGLRTFHGLMSHGFPNMFFTGFTQNAVTAAHNLIYEQQAVQLAHIVREVLSRGKAWAEPTQAAEDAWVDTIHRNLNLNAQFTLECTPGYFTNEGKGNRLSPLFGEPYGPGMVAFDHLLRDWRQNRNMPGLDLGGTA